MSDPGTSGFPDGARRPRGSARPRAPASEGLIQEGRAVPSGAVEVDDQPLVAAQLALQPLAELLPAPIALRRVAWSRRAAEVPGHRYHALAAHAATFTDEEGSIPHSYITSPTDVDEDERERRNAGRRTRLSYSRPASMILFKNARVR